ncbi:hypothetical protein CKM354_000448500 [Cercospora kikuchii]|uniref:Uncharacterized protein n=1 Tax=Cercospora kikuchii TaxID=84275 RepID=A0A9P3CJZ5_9PEZI|nr:uncharacterized protein CKM354_000448500 [Cercospora kikuchii]GIZ41170.1 hypothetical protein CKM354_000448500 [Cercospora kikuchii]
MGRPAWQIEERRDNLCMHTETDLDKVQIHDLMGRIYGEIWHNSDWRKYTVKDIHDEIMSRWKKGHRHNHYRTIDRESGVHDAEETRARNDTRNRVTAAAAQTCRNNWLRENNNGKFDAAFGRIIGIRLPSIATGGGRASSETASAGLSTPARPIRKRKAPATSSHATPKRPETVRSTAIEDDASTEAGNDDSSESMIEEGSVDEDENPPATTDARPCDRG